MQKRTSRNFLKTELNEAESSSDDHDISAKESGDLMSGFIFPAFWNNDILMEPLMGPFQECSSDPYAYDLKLTFWQDMIGAFCMQKRSPIFNKLELQLAFKRKNRIPYGLEIVLEEMLYGKQIRVLKEYQVDPCNTWKGWAVNVFIKKPVKWAIRKIPLVGEVCEDEAKIEFIQLEIMQKFCSNLETYLEQHAGKLLYFQRELKEIQEQLQLSEDVIHLCLETLYHKRVIGLEYSLEKNGRRIQFIKIPGKCDPAIEITETNRAVFNLQTTQRSLLEQLESIENDIAINEERARQYVKEGKKQLAKTYLRKKLLLMRNHEKRSVALHNVETLLFSVDEAKTNGEILGAYKTGSKALQNMLQSGGLNYENVDEVVSEIRETIDTHNELNETMANANVIDSKLEDDIVERELKEILGESSKSINSSSKSKENTIEASIQNTGIVSSKNDFYGNNNTAVKNIEISDADLLAMLDELEVEQNSPGKSIQGSQCTISTND